MRSLAGLVLVLGCQALPPVAVSGRATPSIVHLTADTPETTARGNTFVAPAGWTVEVRSPATILTAPESDSHIVIIDIVADDVDTAVAVAWSIYDPAKRWPLVVATDSGVEDGWTNIRTYTYTRFPGEHSDLSVEARHANGAWTITIFDVAPDVSDKRSGDLETITGRLLPKGYAREDFRGRHANRLDAPRLAELTRFVERARHDTGVPGVAVGVIQDGKVVLATGFGLRELGRQATVDADTLFMIASDTKQLTTLMLAKLVDENKLAWETPAASLLPTFKLGDADTTSKVMVKHLVCACTGLPRQDLEWLFEFKDRTAEATIASLGASQPTSRFGEIYQYSNILAGVAGFLGGHVAFPKLELARAYDMAMQTRVLAPLGMSATTFDYARALQGNHASPHGPALDNKTAVVRMDVNYAAIPIAPAAGAWSSVSDLLKVVAMELAEGRLPDGTRYLAKEPLLARRAPQVRIGNDRTYGMGLMVDTRYGTPILRHDGHMLGFHSLVFWLPEHEVGAVVLTNGELGDVIHAGFRRKLLEVLFDAHAEADINAAAQAKSYFDQVVADRRPLAVPADETGQLAAHYHNDQLGDIVVRKDGASTIFDFGEWQSEVASRRDPNGTISFITISPGVMWFDFVVGPDQTLVIRDAQHAYWFVPVSAVKPPR